MLSTKSSTLSARQLIPTQDREGHTAQALMGPLAHLQFALKFLSLVIVLVILALSLRYFAQLGLGRSPPNKLEAQALQRGAL